VADVFECFLHNWVAAVSMETAWQTAVEASADAQIEERLGLTTKPRRTLKVRWDGVTKAESHRLFFGLSRQADQSQLLVPLYQDVAETTASSSGSTVNAPTTTRRIYPGQQVFLFQIAQGRPTNVQRRTVNTVSAASFTTTVALSGTYPAGSIVVPLIACKPSLDWEGRALTDVISSFEHTFVEDMADALEAAADYDDLVGEFDTALGEDGATSYFVLDVGPNWGQQVALAVARSGLEVDLGRDQVVIPRGPRPSYMFQFTAVAVDRDEAWRVIQFADAHRGRLVPFFVPNPLTLWTVTNAAVGWVEVTRSGDLDDPLSFADFLFLETTAGVVYVREITGVTDSSGANRIAVSPDLPLLTANEIRRATTAHLCRFRADAFREEWVSSSCATFAFDVEEVLGEVPEVSVA
jgi:hypothetical protein